MHENQAKSNPHPLKPTPPLQACSLDGWWFRFKTGNTSALCLSPRHPTLAVWLPGPCRVPQCLCSAAAPLLSVLLWCAFPPLARPTPPQRKRTAGPALPSASSVPLGRSRESTGLQDAQQQSLSARCHGTRRKSQTSRCTKTCRLRPARCPASFCSQSAYLLQPETTQLVPVLELAAAILQRCLLHSPTDWFYQSRSSLSCTTSVVQRKGAAVSRQMTVPASSYIPEPQLGQTKDIHK